MYRNTLGPNVITQKGAIIHHQEKCSMKGAWYHLSKNATIVYMYIIDFICLFVYLRQSLNYSEERICNS